MLAVPEFGAGAMENWGLIIYRETALLYDPNSSSTANKMRVATVISHELAHQVRNDYLGDDEADADDDDDSGGSSGGGGDEEEDDDI